jgi:hypothetical protein
MRDPNSAAKSPPLPLGPADIPGSVDKLVFRPDMRAEIAVTTSAPAIAPVSLVVDTFAPLLIVKASASSEIPPPCPLLRERTAASSFRSSDLA